MTSRDTRVLALTAALTPPACAQQFLHPAKGQSPEQQKQDEATCCQWAVEQTGFDPAEPPPPAECRYCAAAGHLRQGARRVPRGQGLHGQVTPACESDRPARSIN